MNRTILVVIILSCGCQLRLGVHMITSSDPTSYEVPVETQTHKVIDLGINPLETPELTTDLPDLVTTYVDEDGTLVIRVSEFDLQTPSVLEDLNNRYKYASDVYDEVRVEVLQAKEPQ